ncbi:hypothetical protein HPB49_019040 [Dermacentor silvarum]|uniref:Uncharacterized protein n=1 Tax=Dermacentor silvarum TaxID=543639 RepID=A0ACB8E2E7_DERSI|nr:hypothetical protein HPB49_019040 [Dermacentor silvarum]
MDSRLAHLIEAKTSILSRWKGQRLNKRLRKKVALLNENIKEHCRVLNQQQWAELCNSLDGQLHHSRSWKILKHLLDNTSTRSQQQDRLTKLLFTETKTHGQDHVTNTLCQKYIPSGPAKPHGPYTGSSNSALDEDFSVAEHLLATLHVQVTGLIASSVRHRAPGVILTAHCCPRICACACFLSPCKRKERHREWQTWKEVEIGIFYLPPWPTALAA